MILLDTDVVIDLLRGKAEAQAWLASLNNEILLIPGFVALELLQGCTNKQDQLRVEKLIGKFQREWGSPQVYKNVLESFKQFHLSHGIGMIDALIGNIAIDLGLLLYTFNQKHYRVIERLNTIQPYPR